MILIRLETDNTLSIIKTDDKSFEQRDTPNDVKTYSQVVREPNAARETIALELYIHSVQVDRNEAAIAYLDIDAFTLLPYKAKRQSKIGFEHTIALQRHLILSLVTPVIDVVVTYPSWLTSDALRASRALRPPLPRGMAAPSEASSEARVPDSCGGES